MDHGELMMTTNIEKKWYIVNVQTGSEGTGKTAIAERMRSQKMEQYFGEILIPAENIVQLVKGQRHTKSRKFSPAYMFIQMFLNDEAWHLVNHSAKVTGS